MHKINKDFYRSMVKQGWTLGQIDEADIFYLFDINKPETIRYADQVPWL